MIAVNELRIGNLVNEGIVIAIFEDKIQVKDKYGNYHYRELSPIILTEDILLNKCGFNCLIDSSGDKWIRLKCDNYFGSFVINIVNGEFIVSDRESSEFLILKYVHQLQNFYFVFSNKELNISL